MRDGQILTPRSESLANPLHRQMDMWTSVAVECKSLSPWLSSVLLFPTAANYILCLATKSCESKALPCFGDLLQIELIQQEGGTPRLGDQSSERRLQGQILSLWPPVEPKKHWGQELERISGTVQPPCLLVTVGKPRDPEKLSNLPPVYAARVRTQIFQLQARDLPNTP